MLDFSLAQKSYMLVPLHFQHYQLNCRAFFHLEEDEPPLLKTETSALLKDIC